MLHSFSSLPFFPLAAAMLCILSNIMGCKQLELAELDPAAQVPPYPADTWQLVSDPSQYGWNEDSLEAVRLKAEAMGTHTMMVIDSGRLIAAWGDITDKYYIASCRKSVLSTLYGKYVEDSIISLDATLADLNIDDQAGLSDAEKQATVRQLLLSSSNIYHPAAAQDNGALPERGSVAPGTQFSYNNFDFNVLGTIFREQTGQDIFEEFHTQIASQIGMEDFDWEQDGRYDYNRNASEHPAYHFDMTARDMARFGLLCLREGKWEGKQVISTDWLRESTQPIADAHEFGASAYGYMWWVVEGDVFGKAGFPDGSFSAQGFWNQLIMIVPAYDLVIVHRGKGRRGARISPQESLAMLTTLMNARG